MSSDSDRTKAALLRAHDALLALAKRANELNAEAKDDNEFISSFLPTVDIAFEGEPSRRTDLWLLARHPSDQRAANTKLYLERLADKAQERMFALHPSQGVVSLTEAIAELDQGIERTGLDGDIRAIASNHV